MTGEVKRALRRDCTALLLAALLVRGGLCGAAPAFTARPVCAQAAAPAETAETAEPAETAEARTLPPLRLRDVPETAAGPVFTAADAALVSVGGNCTLGYDTAALLTQPAPDWPETAQILIVHTHGTEAYTPEAGREYAPLSAWSTLDADCSVIRVGEAIRARLAAHGITAVHDTTLCDYPVYRGAYDRMEAVIADNLARLPEVRMVLDIHRDAFDNPDGSAGTTAVDGTARVMLVAGTDEGGLYHPDWQAHLGLAMQLQVLMERAQPGITRPISLCRQRYNQHMTPGSLLVEFGAAGDTLTEALAAADVFADALAALLLGG